MGLGAGRDSRPGGGTCLWRSALPAFRSRLNCPLVAGAGGMRPESHAHLGQAPLLSSFFQWPSFLLTGRMTALPTLGYRIQSLLRLSRSSGSPFLVQDESLQPPTHFYAYEASLDPGPYLATQVLSPGFLVSLQKHLLTYRQT